MGGVLVLRERSGVLTVTEGVRAGSNRGGGRRGLAGTKRSLGVVGVCERGVIGVCGHGVVDVG